MRKSKRLFLAVDLPEELKERLGEVERKWSHFPARWVSSGNLHITFAFLGDVAEENIPKLTETIGEALGSTTMKLNIVDIVYGPEARRRRLIWARLADANEVVALYEALRARLMSLPFKVYTEYKKPSHITLARFNSLNLRGWNEDELPDVEEQVNYNFTAGSIELIESKLHRGGPEYFVLHSFVLSDTP